MNYVVRAGAVAPGADFGVDGVARHVLTGFGRLLWRFGLVWSEQPSGPL